MNSQLLSVRDKSNLRIYLSVREAMEQLELITVTKWGLWTDFAGLFSLLHTHSFIHSSVECTTQTIPTNTAICNSKQSTREGRAEVEDASDPYHNLQLTLVVRIEVVPLQITHPSPNRNRLPNGTFHPHSHLITALNIHTHQRLLIVGIDS